MKYIVYLTINTKSIVNGQNRIYVGVHKTQNPEIFDGYLGCGVKINQPSTYKYPKTPFQFAVKKYGVRAFKRTTLFIFNTPEEAYRKEREIVDIDFLKLSYTYNACIGGQFYINYKTLYQFDLKGKLIKTWEYSIEAYEFYGYSLDRFQYAIQDKRVFLDSLWSFNKTINISEYSNKQWGEPKITYLYNKDGKCIKEFKSRKECADYLNTLESNVCRVIKTQKMFSKTYYISDKLTDLFIPKPRRQLINTRFYIYNEKSELIGQGIGKEIMAIIKCYSWNKINDCFRYHQNWYKNFYISESIISKVPQKVFGNKKKVDVYDKYGNFIETIDSIKEVKIKYKIPSSKIKNLETGDKYFKGYIFKYSKM